MTTTTIKLSPKQREMLEKAAADPDFRAGVGFHVATRRTAEKLVEYGLGTIAFYGATVFYINRAGLAYLAEAG
jgi:hypothetical protein